jgi:dolichol-phosphate mannosyltransferase
LTTPPESVGRPQLSVVLPTYNEAGNVAALIDGIRGAMGGTSIEIIVIDDGSPDRTPAIVRELAEADPRVRLIERAGKQGLSSAVFAGANAANGSYVAVMDADLSHDPEELPDMLAKAIQGYDVVIGSRFVRGSANQGQPLVRRAMSVLLNTGARLVLQLRPNDVLTGYVLCRRKLLTTMPTRYSAGGFKWLIELLATQRGIRVHEWPIRFRDREQGSSKANLREVLTFAILCARLTIWRIRRVPGR